MLGYDMLEYDMLGYDKMEYDVAHSVAFHAMSSVLRDWFHCTDYIYSLYRL